MDVWRMCGERGRGRLESFVLQQAGERYFRRQFAFAMLSDPGIPVPARKASLRKFYSSLPASFWSNSGRLRAFRSYALFGECSSFAEYSMRAAAEGEDAPSSMAPGDLVWMLVNRPEWVLEWYATAPGEPDGILPCRELAEAMPSGREWAP